MSGSRPVSMSANQKYQSASSSAFRAKFSGEDTSSVDDYSPPVTRGDCLQAPRPCPWVRCRYHLYLDVDPVSGSIKLNFPNLEVWDLEETCALDVADRHGATLEQVGKWLNLTRERISQIEKAQRHKLKHLRHDYDVEDSYRWCYPHLLSRVTNIRPSELQDTVDLMIDSTDNHEEGK